MEEEIPLALVQVGVGVEVQNHLEGILTLIREPILVRLQILVRLVDEAFK